MPFLRKSAQPSILSPFSGSFGIHIGALEILAAISVNSFSFVGSLAGLGILELLRVVVEEVREALRLQLLGEQPHHLGLFLLHVPQPPAPPRCWIDA